MSIPKDLLLRKGNGTLIIREVDKIYGPIVRRGNEFEMIGDLFRRYFKVM